MDDFMEQAAVDLDERFMQEVELHPAGGELISTSTSTVLAEGIEISVSSSHDENVRKIELVTSYTGVIPRGVDNYIGRVIEMVGSVVVPVEYEEEVYDLSEPVLDEMGYPLTRVRRFKTCLFKLSAKDDLTGMNIVLSGGGKQGMQFAYAMCQTFGPGDWDTPRRVLISQESGTIRRGHSAGTPRRMYRFLLLPE